MTKEFGSVNSRVFDAIASGVLVITNGDLGAEETFNGILPVYKSKNDLKDILKYYLSNEKERKAKIRELEEFVMSNHTYDHRAIKIKGLLQRYILKRTIAIKIPVPDWDEVENWGDYYLALGLKKELEKKGYDVILQILPEWVGGGDAGCDVVIVLRGLSRYKPKPQHFNIMWNVSHPDDVTLEEYNQYQHVFIASEFWASEIAKKVDVPVEVLLQCTDPKLFYPDYSPRYEHDLLFVGNSRNIFRKVIKDVLSTSYDLSIYGKGWEKFIDKKYIKGEHIPNSELRKAYSSCKILLNDHWDDMRENGFISNRLFDGFAAGAFIISDHVKGGKDVFGDVLVTYKNSDELKELIEYYINNEIKHNKKYEDIIVSVINEHNYQNRVKRILEIIELS